MPIFSREAGVCPASAIQEQFWILNQCHPESPAYNVPLLFRIRGPLDRACLEKSLNDLVARHQILRTRFVFENRMLSQCIEPEMPVALGLEPTGGGEAVQGRITEAVRRPFKLSELPLIRFRLFQAPGGEHLFLVVMHHIITDLRSKALFAAELSRLYGAYLGQGPVGRVAPAAQYVDFSLWQRGWLKGQGCRAMVAFWQKTLKGHTGLLELPMAKKRPGVLSLRGEALDLHFGPEETGALKRFSKKHRVTPFLTLLGAYVVLLFRYSGQSRLAVGVPLTNRRRAEDKETLGCFVNILPLALTLDGLTGFPELLGRVRQAMLGGHRNQEVPFRLLVHALQKRPAPGCNPLFQAGFTFEPPVSLSLSGLEVTAVPLHGGGSQLDLFLTLWEGAGGVRGYLEYNTDLFDAATVRRVADNYRTLVGEILRDGNRAILALPLASRPGAGDGAVRGPGQRPPPPRGCVNTCGGRVFAHPGDPSVTGRLVNH